MEEIRGRVPLNMNDQQNLYRHKKKNLAADLHINKNHNIFEDGYNYRVDSMDDELDR